MPTAPNAIDLSFRPDSYFFPASFTARLLARIQGAERRAVARTFIEQGRIDELPPFFAKARLTYTERAQFGRLHPDCMGGEYLPRLATGEVEIARVTIASTTQDVTAVYARPGKHCIRYRVVDEYEGTSLCSSGRRWSRRPLTLDALVSFLDSAWPIRQLLGGISLRQGESCIERMLAFVTSVESEFYPQIEALYRQRIVEWATQHLHERGLGAAEEVGEERGDAREE